MNAPVHWMERVSACKQAGGNDILEESGSKIRDCQGSFDLKPVFSNQAWTARGWKSKFSGANSTGSRRERIPGLAAQSIAQDGFQVAFVGKFQDKVRPGLQDVPYLAKRSGGIGHVVQDTDHGGCIE